MKITINDVTYEVVKNEKEAIDEEVLKEKITDYFDSFDYIVGDWAYGKIRLKGFNEKTNKNFKQLNEEDKNRIVKLFYDGKSKMEIIKEMNTVIEDEVIEDNDDASQASNEQL